jgi:hypothetical protein
LESEERKLDSEEVRRLAAESKDLMADPAFKAAILALRRQWHAEQMVALDDKVIVALALKMQALEAIPQQLQVFINDHTWAEKRKH